MNDHGVRYLLIGGYAIAHYGMVRYTKDIDFWIAADPENAGRVADTVNEFFGTDVEAKTFLRRPLVFRAGIPPNRIELITEISACEFNDCYNRRVVTKLDGVETNVISLADLRKNKLATGRPQDRVDADNLPPVED